MTVLRASGDEGEQHLDFGLIEQLHADGEASDVPVMTMFGRSGPRPDPLDVGADLVRVATEASAFLPVVAIIDDAQWADQASLQALTYALRRFRNQRLLTVIAQRPDVPALGPLRRLCRDERGTVVQLGGLAPPQLATLLHDARGISLGERAALRLREHTRGNPLEALILADEPTGNLDSKTGREIMELLCCGLGRDEGRAIVIVTHDHRLRQIADRVLWLEDGHLTDGDARVEWQEPDREEPDVPQPIPRIYTPVH